MKWTRKLLVLGDVSSGGTGGDIPAGGSGGNTPAGGSGGDCALEPEVGVLADRVPAGGWRDVMWEDPYPGGWQEVDVTTLPDRLR